MKQFLIAPELFAQDFSLVESFFSYLSKENRNIRGSIQEALTNMIPAYKGVDKWEKQFQELIIKNIVSVSIVMVVFEMI